MSLEIVFKNKNNIRCLKRLELFISACLTIVLATFTIVYTLQQNAIAEAYREQDQQAAQILHEQQVYDNYIDEISRHLVSLRQNPRRKNENWPQLKQHIRMKTLSALPQMNPKQRQNILFFLYDNELIRSDPTFDSINLSGADFSSLKFADHRCYLVNLSLRYVFANEIEFSGCNLEYADFTGSQMIGSKFVHCRIGSTRFIKTNLTDAVFDKSNIAGLKLQNAILVRSQFTDEPLNSIFMNTDLLDNNWRKESIVNFTFNQRINRVSNTRFSDGTFSQIDSQQLLFDNSAELGCDQIVDTYLYNEPQPGWRQDVNYDVVSLIDAKRHNIDLRPVTGQCYFQCPLNKSELEQAINVKNYSLIIDSGQTSFNISAFFSCPFQFGQVYLEIGFYTDQLTSADNREPLKLIFDGSIFDPERFHFLSLEGNVPSTTRTIYLAVGAHRLATQSSAYCLVDDIGLNLFKIKTSLDEH